MNPFTKVAYARTRALYHHSDPSATYVTFFEDSFVLDNYEGKGGPKFAHPPCTLKDEYFEVLKNAKMWNPITKALIPLMDGAAFVTYDDMNVPLPLNPADHPTGMRGRGILGHWGANHASDPLVTKCINSPSGERKVYVFCIQRADCLKWALPGGMVDPHENVADTFPVTCIREFEEEVMGGAKDKGNPVNMQKIQEFLEELIKCYVGLVYIGMVDDPRATDNAWIETTVHHFNLSQKAASLLNPNPDKSEAAKAEWCLVTDDFCDNMYASHGDWVKQVYMSLTAPSKGLKRPIPHDRSAR